MSVHTNGIVGAIDARELPSPDPASADLQRLIGERRAANAAVAARLDSCSDALTRAASLLIESLITGGKILTCGNGGSASEAQHFAAELAGRFRRERRPYAAMALTTDSSTLTSIANDYGYEEAFARQVEGLGRFGDALVAISTSGESENVVRAAWTARNRGMAVVAMTGERPSRLANIASVALQVPSEDTPTIQEFQMMFTHLLCEVVEAALACREAHP